MKTIFNKEKQGLIILLTVILSIPAFGKIKHTVEIVNGRFSPKDITISVGDTIVWRNNTGDNHNVNGTTATYPSNPETFGNSVGSNWTYSHVFMTPGDYDYRCNEHFAFGMVGTITVQTATGVDFNQIAGFSKLFPNPAREKVFIEPSGFTASSVQVEIYDITGKVQFSGMFSLEKRVEINVDQMVKGIYFVKLSDKSNEQIFKLIKN